MKISTISALFLFLFLFFFNCQKTKSDDNSAFLSVLLSAGSQNTPSTPKRIFITTNFYNPSQILSTAGADAICNAETVKPTQGFYKALLSDGATRIACTTAGCGSGSGPSQWRDWVLRQTTIYYQADGKTYIGMTSNDAIFAAPLTYSMSVISSAPWTGLAGNWTSSASNCHNFNSALAAYSGSVGDSTATAVSAAISNTSLPCTESHQLICVEVF